MRSHKYKSAPTAQARLSPAADDDQSTRRRLIEVAGRLIAERGVDRVTGKEVAARAKVNAAAINYHFGGFQGLYAVVLCEAHHRLAAIESLQSAVAEAPDTHAKLEAFIRLFVTAITGPASETWIVRVLGREFVAPTPAMELLREKEIIPKAGILRQVVAELMDLPQDHPAVAHGCISVVAPCVMLMIGNRQTLKRLFPALNSRPDDSQALIRHMVSFALAGLSAIAAEVHHPQRPATAVRS